MARQFVISLIGDSKSAEDAFKRTARAGDGFADAFKKVGIGLAAVFTAIVAGAVAVGRQFVQLGQEFDDAFDRIRIGTGATGAALAALDQSFRNVAVGVPSSFEDVSRVIADLNTRTGLTGPALEGMATQLLTVSRLMEEDVAETVRSTTRLFGQFNVPIAEQPALLDKLFRAAQASGAGFNQLAEAVRVSAPALQALGFNLDESIALLARFERDGVSGERVVAAFGIAVRNFARDGVPLREGLADIIVELQTLDQTAATARGIEIFGRGALDVVDAIRSGKFDVEELYQIIANGDETIMRAAEETDGLRESWANFKNFLKLQFEGPATEVFTTLEGVIARLKPVAEEVMAAYDKDGLGGALDVLQREWNAVYEEYIEPLWLGFLKFLEQDVKPVAIRLGAEIGTGIASAMISAVWNALENLTRKVLPFIPVIGPAYSDLLALSRAVQSTIPSTSAPSTTSRLSVTPMAEGGIVTKPLFPALIGEAGPEAVIPLDRLGEFGGGQTTVNVMVTSADPQAVVEALRKYVRANGPLGQVVSV